MLCGFFIYTSIFAYDIVYILFSPIMFKQTGKDWLVDRQTNNLTYWTSTTSRCVDLPLPTTNASSYPSNSETLKDEFCSNESFEIASNEELVEKILVTADCQADWNDSVVIKLIDEKLNSIGITIKSISVNRNARKCFESCVVTMSLCRGNWSWRNLSH
jgi:hypothetical protein